MKITILTVGKIKEKYLKDAIAEYAKRLSRYCKLQIVEVEDEKTPDGASAAMEDQIKEKEAVRILKHISTDQRITSNNKNINITRENVPKLRAFQYKNPIKHNILNGKERQ